VAGVVALVAAACGGAGSDNTLRVSGSTTVNPIIVDAAETLRPRGLDITVDTQGGSAGGIAQLGNGEIDVAMSSKPVGDDDRARYPGTDFVETSVGEDAIAVVIRSEVYDAGVRDLTKDEVKGLFEGRITNWSELGGPDLAVFVYDKEPGRGTREVFDTYLYGDEEPPPPPTSPAYAVIGGNEEGRAKTSSTPGAVTILSIAFVEGQAQLAAVALDGVEPVPASVVDGTYPLSRPLYLVTDGPPEGPSATLVDFVLSEQGQALVADEGYLTLADLGGG